MLAVFLGQILLLEDGLVPGIVERNIGFYAAEALFDVLGDIERAKRSRIDK
jgi:hypothetical protein